MQSVRPAVVGRRIRSRVAVTALAPALGRGKFNFETGNDRRGTAHTAAGPTIVRLLSRK